MDSKAFKMVNYTQLYTKLTKNDEGRFLSKNY